MDEEKTSIIPRDEVHILVTEDDKTGEDILAMSDFFDGYVQQLTDSIRTNAVTTYVPSIPIADIGIIGEVVQRAEVISQGTTQLLRDFDSLPKDIHQKIKDGIYNIEEANRPGTTLIDGEDLVEKLRELQLGVAPVNDILLTMHGFYQFRVSTGYIYLHLNP